jgi:hypothetical protein
MKEKDANVLFQLSNPGPLFHRQDKVEDESNQPTIKCDALKTAYYYLIPGNGAVQCTTLPFTYNPITTAVQPCVPPPPCCPLQRNCGSSTSSSPLIHQQFEDKVETETSSNILHFFQSPISGPTILSSKIKTQGK